MNVTTLIALQLISSAALIDFFKRLDTWLSILSMIGNALGFTTGKVAKVVGFAFGLLVQLPWAYLALNKSLYGLLPGVVGNGSVALFFLVKTVWEVILPKLVESKRRHAHPLGYQRLHTRKAVQRSYSARKVCRCTTYARTA